MKRYLQEHPDESASLALSYYEDFSILATEYKRLEQENQALQSQLIKLRQSSSGSPKLPDFLRRR